MSEIATFPPASLASQLTELKRERAERERRYPMDLARRVLHERNAQLQNRGLDAAIATLEKITAAQARGEPGRKELIAALREALPFVKSPNTCAPSDALAGRIEAMLDTAPE